MWSAPDLQGRWRWIRSGGAVALLPTAGRSFGTGSEFLRAKAAGLIGDDHIVGEIGQVMAGEISAAGRPRRLLCINRWGTLSRTWRALGRCIRSLM